MTLGDRVVVMHRGEIQQYGSPLEIYKYPANRFVAGFVGMPPMNFVDGQLEPDGSDSLSFQAAGLRVPLPAVWSASLRGRTGQEVTLGIRPSRCDRSRHRLLRRPGCTRWPRRWKSSRSWEP